MRPGTASRGLARCVVHHLGRQATVQRRAQPHGAEVVFDIREIDKRPVSAVADFTEVRDVVQVSVREDRNITLNLLFDPEHNLEERILSEQFVT